MVASAFRTIFAHASAEEIAAQWDHVAQAFAGRFPNAAALMEGAEEKVLAIQCVPTAHWRQLWSPSLGHFPHSAGRGRPWRLWSPLPNRVAASAQHTCRGFAGVLPYGGVISILRNTETLFRSAKQPEGAG